MYAQTDTLAPPPLLPPLPPAAPATARPTRAILQTRPLYQRALIRSWEYIRPVRIAILAVRLAVVVWLYVLGALLMSAGYTAGWTLFPAAAAVLVLSAWIFAIASKGWPVTEA